VTLLCHLATVVIVALAALLGLVANWVAWIAPWFWQRRTDRDFPKARVR
jgi:hypothetical protein